MNSIIQNVLVFVALATAIGFLVKKFLWKKTSKTNKGCGTDDCGCH